MVTHVPQGIRPNLPDVLRKLCALPIRFAEDGEKVRPDQILFAGSDPHLLPLRDQSTADGYRNLAIRFLLQRTPREPAVIEQPALAGKNILAVEDEYFIASDVQRLLSKAGAQVGGPVSSVAAGLAAVGQRRLDAVVLDINLGGELSFPIADKLLSAGTPSSITTGYEDRVIPGRVAGRPRVAEPVTASMLVGQLHDLIQSEDGE